MLNNSQNIKLFDRKFVANTIRNLRRCPKCHSEYSSNYDRSIGDSHVKSNRPFLLPCGHDMCENCVIHHKRNLTCSECLKPIELPHQQLTYFHVRDYFDLNFFLLGQLNHLKFYRKDASANSILKAIPVSTNSVLQNTTTQCNECEIGPATGKCQLCKVYMCRRCFDGIHRNSKTLKKHNWVPLDKERNAYDMYKLPTPKRCTRHNRVADRFCHKCYFVCCDICARADHKNHGYRTLQEENNKSLGEVAPLLETVNSYRESVKNAQKEIKSVESQMEEYATKTLEDISNYFLKLHNFLQNEEKRITEEFNALCQQPQIDIKQAFVKLSESNELLRTMRSNLELYQYKAPLDVSLRAILSVYNKQLQLLPCRLNISKLKGNPFRFEANMDVLKDLPRYYKTSYNEPEICINISAFYEDSAYLSSRQGSSQKLEKAQSQHKNNGNNTKKYNNNNTSNGSSVHNIHSEKDNASAVDAIACYNDDTTTSFHSSITSNSQDHDMRVKLTHVKSPADFYVQRISTMEQIRKMSHTYVNDIYTDRIPQVISEDYYYMIYHNTDKQWYRGIVKKILPNNLYKIFLVDFGIHMDATKDRLCEIDEDHLKIPFAAIRCTIHNLVPHGKEWTEEAKHLLMEILQNQPARLSVFEIINKGLHSVDLHNNATKSLRESFLYTGLAREVPGHSTFKMEIKTICPSITLKNRIPKNIFQIGEMFGVTMAHVEDPGEFYVIKTDLITELNDFVTKLNDFYTKTSLNLQQLYVGSAQTCCAICCDEVWHRAVIEDVKEKGDILVRLVDKGVIKVVSWRQAFVLVERFRRIKEYVTRCSLADIVPSQKDGYVYSHTAINDFKLMVDNPQLLVEIVGIENNEYKVVVYISKKKLDINVGASLVKRGHGISTGEATQMAEVYKTPKTPEHLKNQIEAQYVPNEAKDLANDSGYLGRSKKRVLQRSATLITHIVDPGEFYVQLECLLAGAKAFHQKLQEIHNLKYKEISPYVDDNMLDWKDGDHCLIYTKHLNERTTLISHDSSIRLSFIEKCEWYRGIIKGIKDDAIGPSTYDIFLRDIGITLYSMPKSHLFSIDDQLDRVTNAVHRCHLACIEPSGDTLAWSLTAVDCFKDSIGKFESLSVTMQGNLTPDRESVPIVLWGSLTENSDPLAPSLVTYSNINSILVNAGLAYMVERLDVTQQLDKIEEINLAENAITLEEWLKTNSAVLAAVGSNADGASNSLVQSVCDDTNIEEYSFEKDPNGLCIQLSTGLRAPPDAWRTSRVIEKTIFTGYPTYVDHYCNIYIQDSLDCKMAEKMGKNLGKFYGSMAPQPPDYTYEPGQPCVAAYNENNANKFYRCVVVEPRNSQNKWAVYYIDYGNIEYIGTKVMRPYAPYPNFPAIANKFRIEGIKPKNGSSKYSTEALDFIHANIVGQHVTVRVSLDEVDSMVKLCTIRCGGLDIKDYAITEGYVDNKPPSPILSSHKNNYLSKSWKKRNEAMDDFMSDNDGDEESNSNVNDKEEQVHAFESLNKLIANLEKNGQMNFEKSAKTHDYHEESLLPPPPPTKRRMFNNDEYSQLLSLETDHSDLDEAFVMEDDAQEDYIEEDKDVALLEESFAKGYWHSVQTDMHDDEKLRQRRSPSSRLYDQDSDFDEFNPNATSSVRTHISGLQNFKQPQLPPGMQNFLCYVISVLTPTILQIVPYNAEFRYRDVELQRTIKHLVKTSKPLISFGPGTICLACYSKDNKWYRAAICSYHTNSKMVQVIYVDYLNSETLPLNKLRRCPTELLSWPLRTFRVRLHDVKCNPLVSEHKIRLHLEKLLSKNKLVFAMIEKVPKESKKESYFSSNALRAYQHENDGNLMQVLLYETKEAALDGCVIYEPLIESNLFLRI